MGIRGARITGAEPPPTVIDQLAERSWPGNVRELRNAVERAALVGLEPGAGADSEATYQQAKEVGTRGWLAQLLRRHDGNLSRTARAARMGRSHLREIVRRYQLGAMLAS